MITVDTIRFFYCDDLSEHEPRDFINLSDYFSTGDGDPRPVIDATAPERAEILRMLDDIHRASHLDDSLSVAVADIIRTWTDAEVIQRLSLDPRALPFYRARPYFFGVEDLAAVQDFFGLAAKPFFHKLESHGYQPLCARDFAVPRKCSEASHPDAVVVGR